MAHAGEPRAHRGEERIAKLVDGDGPGGLVYGRNQRAVHSIARQSEDWFVL